MTVGTISDFLAANWRSAVLYGIGLGILCLGFGEISAIDDAFVLHARG